MANPSNTAGYQVLAAPCEHTYEEKRSLFTAILLPVGSREEAMDALAEVRRSRPGASHYCWAYILGDAEQPKGQAFSDDGEPGGTAGKPMLNVLTHRRAGDCLAVVVRVFGGVKLGAGGLVRAYSAAVSQAAEKAEWRDRVPSSVILIEVDFGWEERVRHCLDRAGVTLVEAQYGEGVGIRTRVPCGQREGLIDELRQITSGQAQVTYED